MKNHKYNARPRWVCPTCLGRVANKNDRCMLHDEQPIYFGSSGELQRFIDLRLLEHTGQVTDLERQVRYHISVNGIQVTTYIADFVYKIDGNQVVEDYKGKDTDGSKLRRKLMKAALGIDVMLTSKSNLSQLVKRKQPRLRLHTRKSRR